MAIAMLAAAVMLWMAAGDGPAAAAGREAELLALLDRMEASYSRVEDYTAIFRRHERVKGNLKPWESIELKFKKPLHIYMRWLDVPHKEAIYVEGTNGNRVVAHSGDSLTWNLDPNGRILLAGNRHPITDVGFGFILQLMHTNFRLAVQHADIQILRLEDDAFGGRPAVILEAKFNPGNGRKYYASRFVCHIDKEYLLPVAIASYDDRDELMEEYGYREVKINVGLTAMDFSRNNEDYGF